MIRFLITCLYIFLPVLLVAQVEITSNEIIKDSTNINFVQPINQQPSRVFLPKGINKLYKTTTSKYNYLSNTYMNLPKLKFYVGPKLEASYSRNPYANDYDYSGIIGLNENSWISGGSARHTYLTGTMQSATAIYNRRITDRLTIGIGETINKYSISSGKNLISEGRVHIIADYKINDKMNLSLQGDYSLSRTNGGSSPGSLIGRYFPEMPGDLFYGFTPIYSTNLTLDYKINNWIEFSPGLYSSRYEFFNNHLNDYGLNGIIGLRANEYIKFNLFGQKSLKGGGNNIGINDMHTQDMYGGGIELKLTDKISVETGVIRELNPWNGKWVTKPYVKPVFHLK